MVSIKFYNFWRPGVLTHGASQLELSFLYLTPLPDMSTNWQSFVKIAQKVKDVRDAQ